MKTVGYLFVFLAGALLLLASCTPHVPIPSNGIYHGAYCEFGPTQDDVVASNMNDFEAAAQKKLAVVGFGSFWGQNFFPRDQLEKIREYGAIPLIYWCPWGPPYELETDQPAYSPDSILAGKFNGYIKMWADSMKAWGKPVMVAFAPEMNGWLHPWIGDYNGSNEVTGFGDPALPDGPERFVATYRQVVDSVRKQGVRNVAWVFAPNALNMFEEDWNAIRNYYPGDGYVDWLGMVAFAARYDWDDWILFDSLVGPAYAQLDTLNGTKPMMLAEWGALEWPDLGNKAEWLDTAFAAIKTRCPRVKAAVYWNDQEVIDEEVYDRRIDSSPEALAAYQNGVKDALWLERP